VGDVVNASAKGPEVDFGTDEVDAVDTRGDGASPVDEG
jgi:hypothetical protein